MREPLLASLAGVATGCIYNLRQNPSTAHIHACTAREGPACSLSGRNECWRLFEAHSEEVLDDATKKALCKDPDREKLKVQKEGGKCRTEPVTHMRWLRDS